MANRKSRKYSPLETRNFRSYLRNHMTTSEWCIWNCLNKKQLGVKFRPQVIVDGYIVDFYCHAAALVIEVDGPDHEKKKERDTRRTQYLEERGDRTKTMALKVLRFTNDEVAKDTDRIVQVIQSELRKRIPVVESYKILSRVRKKLEPKDRHYRDELSELSLDV